MSGVTCSVSFDSAGVKERVEDKTKRAQVAIDSMVLSDSNYFVPVKTSMLEKSSITNSVLGSGVLVWRTPYARRQYNGVNFDHSKQLNPNACAKWFEAANARWHDKWIRLANEQFKRS